MSIIDKVKIKPQPQIPDRLYFRIGDVAELLGVKPHVLRYWETEFAMIQPQKSSSGQRVYRKSDVETVFVIKHLLHDERYSIEGAKKRLKELRKSGDAVAEEPAAVEAQVEVFAAPVDALDHHLDKEMGEVRKIALEIQALARAPITDLFSY